MESRAALFREIHKNTWLKRVTADNRKISVGSKKPERYWVVFCVHDDCEALLEGYNEPRQAASHSPDWTVSLQTTQHISHTLVPSENEYEFVITLSGDTVRFIASSWEMMQEWVDTLRLKLREMKILSPKENLYSKLPEVRPPLLPTRDPMSPLPATPPVPAAIVPGVERIANNNQTSRHATVTATVSSTTVSSTTVSVTPSDSAQNSSSNTFQSQVSSSSDASSDADNNYVSTQVVNTPPSTDSAMAATAAAVATVETTTTASSSSAQGMSTALSLPNTSAPTMSNTLTQNLIKMLYPVSTYSHQASNAFEPNTSNSAAFELNESDESGQSISLNESESAHQNRSNSSTAKVETDEGSLARTFASNVLSDPNTYSSNSTSLSSYVSNKRDTFDDSASVDSSSFPIYPTPEPIVLPRLQTTRNANAKTKKLEQPVETSSESANDEAATNITIIQVSSAAIKENLNIPISHESQNGDSENFTNNVQIIPSNFTPSTNDQNAITTVQLKNDENNSTFRLRFEANDKISAATAAATCCTVTGVTASQADVENSRKFTAVASISVKDIPIVHQPISSQTEQQHYEQVFVTQTPNTTSVPPAISAQSENQAKHSTDSAAMSNGQGEIHLNRIKLNKIDVVIRSVTETSSGPSTSTVTFTAATTSSSTNSTNTTTAAVPSSSAAIRSKETADKHRAVEMKRETEFIARRPLLTRGLTEAVITRSRKDKNVLFNRFNSKAIQGSTVEFHANHQQNDLSEHRKRSSSTSDTQGTRNRSNNNNNVNSGNAYTSTSNNNNINNNLDFRRAPGQPFRPPNEIPTQLTLREQQVMQLRREMMHPGGVRIQLRRKDCLNSIAFVDAFGAAWISGWKQKEHPMLYNALHIGDQLISIAGVTVTNAKEANKLINSSSGQFIEFIIRRVPFGRVYAIRREIERQCLGLIRDGNTATIVDVVPNSLSARHGLPPKAQSCDGLSLTFWVLTEINGRPLNLFFKDTEVRDRLNAVGKDISILVQPSDLVSKLKKQLKSLRGYKEYIVQ